MIYSLVPLDGPYIPILYRIRTLSIWLLVLTLLSEINAKHHHQLIIFSSCFNYRNGMVRTFLPQMERNYNGTTYEMRFPAFYFTGFSKNLFVHCTILACVGTQDLCESSPEVGINFLPQFTSSKYSSFRCNNILYVSVFRCESKKARFG